MVAIAKSEKVFHWLLCSSDWQTQEETDWKCCFFVRICGNSAQQIYNIWLQALRSSEPLSYDCGGIAALPFAHIFFVSKPS